MRARHLVRRLGDDIWATPLVAEILNVSDRKAAAIVRDLLSLGYIERAEGRRGDRRRWYRRTLGGNTLALASAARPIGRATADRVVAEFLERVGLVNSSDYYLYRVTKVLAFGSYISDPLQLNDVDLAVELAPRVTDTAKRMELERARTRQARQNGRQFPNIVSELFWPFHEVLLFLKARSRAISLHTTDDAILARSTTRTLFDSSAPTG